MLLEGDPALRSLPLDGAELLGRVVDRFTASRAAEHNLRLVTDALKTAGVDYFLVRGRSALRHVVGVHRSERKRFLDSMRALYGTSAVYAVKPGARGSVAAFSAYVDGALAAPIKSRLVIRFAEQLLSPLTPTYIHSVLKSALEHAVREGEIPRNVARTGTPRPRRFEPLTADEARQCLTVVRNHWLHALFELALRTELRKGELLGLRWEDLDLTGGTATIHCSLQRTRSQGLTVLNTKTLASERRIVLPTECINSLEIHQERQAGRTTDSSSPPRRAGRSTPPTSPAASTAQNSGRSASTTSDTRPPPCSWNRASTSSSSRNFSATPT